MLDQFKQLVHHQADVVVMSVEEFDPRDAYADVIGIVREVAGAAGGHIGVYQLEHGSTRIEYYIVTCDQRHARLIGVKAKAVET